MMCLSGQKLPAEEDPCQEADRQARSSPPSEVARAAPAQRGTVMGWRSFPCACRCFRAGLLHPACSAFPFGGGGVGGQERQEQQVRKAWLCDASYFLSDPSPSTQRSPLQRRSLTSNGKAVCEQALALVPRPARSHLWPEMRGPEYPDRMEKGTG